MRGRPPFSSVASTLQLLNSSRSVSTRSGSNVVARRFFSKISASPSAITGSSIAVRDLRGDNSANPDDELLEPQPTPSPSSSSSQPPPTPSVTARETMALFLRHMWPTNKPHLRRRVILALSLIMTGKLIKVSVPVLFKRIVDGVTEGADHAALLSAIPGGGITLSLSAMIFFYGLGKIGAAVFHEAGPAIFSPVGSAAANNVQLEVFMKLHALDASYHKTRPTGVIVKEIDRASRAFSNISRTVVFVLVPTGLELALASAMLCCEIGAGYAIFAVSVVAVYAAFTIKVTNWRTAFRQQYIAADNEVTSRITDSLLNYNNVKYFQREDFEARCVDEMNHVVNRRVWKLESTLAMLNIGQQAIFATAVAASLAWSSHCVAAGSLTVGSLVMADALLVQMYQPIASLGAVFRELDAGKTNLQATIELLRMPEKPSITISGADFVFKGGEITFEDVVFAYPDSTKNVLDRCSFTIPAGKTVGIIGPSGSGKSTIFSLMFRFFDPCEGRVLIDGQDVSQFNTASVRRHIGIVPQETSVFNGTVMFNLRYARLDATDDEVIDAAKKARLHDTIMQLPQGYDTMLGEAAVKLSGGERQRLSIARVILRGSSIVLADEPTASADARLDSHLMATLREYTRGVDRTLVVVAHRLNSVQNADLILVLNRNGRIEESGTHEQLLEREGLYARLWSEQHQPTMRVIGGAYR